MQPVLCRIELSLLAKPSAILSVSHITPCYPMEKVIAHPCSRQLSNEPQTGRTKRRVDKVTVSFDFPVFSIFLSGLFSIPSLEYFLRFCSLVPHPCCNSSFRPFHFFPLTSCPFTSCPLRYFLDHFFLPSLTRLIATITAMIIFWISPVH